MKLTSVLPERLVYREMDLRVIQMHLLSKLWNKKMYSPVIATLTCPPTFLLSPGEWFCKRQALRRKMVGMQLRGEVKKGWLKP